MLIRGVFTQKIKLWNMIEELVESVDKLLIKDDFSDKTTPCTYNILCTRLRKIGRVTISDGEGPLFQIVDASTNQLRDWDVDEEGEPKCNPVPK
jgi:hypothetical protein